MPTCENLKGQKKCFEKSKWTHVCLWVCQDQRLPMLVLFWNMRHKHLRNFIQNISRWRSNLVSLMMHLYDGEMKRLAIHTRRATSLTTCWLCTQLQTHMDLLFLKLPWFNVLAVTCLQFSFSSFFLAAIAETLQICLCSLQSSCILACSRRPGIRGCKNIRLGGETLKDVSGPYLTYVVYKSYRRPSMQQVRSSGIAKWLFAFRQLTS